MAGIPISALGDPWPGITAGTSLDAPSAILGAVTGDWLGIGLKVLGSGLLGGSKSDISGAAGATGLNTSGWVVGEGTAGAGNLDSSAGLPVNLPWYGWAGFTLAAVLVIKWSSK